MEPPQSFTPTERRLLKLLSDGAPHAPAELLTCLYDSLSGSPALRVALCDLNKKLKRQGQEIVCRSVRRRTIRYQHVRLLVANQSS